MPSFSITLTESEHKRVEDKREDMQKMFVGMSISKNDVVKYMMFGSDKHEARLWDVPIHVLQTDVAEALHARGEDGEDITAVLHRLAEAHAKSRDLHLPKVVVKDIVPGM